MRHGSVSEAKTDLQADVGQASTQCCMALAVSTWKLLSRTQKETARANAQWLSAMQDAVKRTMVISEILDPRTRSLIQVLPPTLHFFLGPAAMLKRTCQPEATLQDLHVSEYVLSNEIVSRALAMASESPMVKSILSELFQAEGNELYIEAASQYIRCDSDAAWDGRGAALRDCLSGTGWTPAAGLERRCASIT